MSKSLNRVQAERRGRARRDYALARHELRYETSPRESSAGPVSAPIKIMDAETKRMIEEYKQRHRM